MKKITITNFAISLCLIAPTLGIAAPLVNSSQENVCERYCDAKNQAGKKPVLTWGETTTRPYTDKDRSLLNKTETPVPVKPAEVSNERYKKTVQPMKVEPSQDIRTPYVDTLSIYVRVVFPDDIKTIRDAVTYLLEPTGYRLVTHYPAPRNAELLVNKRLPPIIRIERTMPVIDALQILVGVDNTVVVDPAHKLISFSKGH